MLRSERKSGGCSNALVFLVTKNLRDHRLRAESADHCDEKNKLSSMRGIQGAGPGRPAAKSPNLKHCKKNLSRKEQSNRRCSCNATRIKSRGGGCLREKILALPEKRRLPQIANDLYLSTIHSTPDSKAETAEHPKKPARIENRRKRRVCRDR